MNQPSQEARELAAVLHSPRPDLIDAALRKAKAEAWDEGHIFTGYWPHEGENPYRKEAK